MSLINDMLKDLEARGDRGSIGNDVRTAGERRDGRTNRTLLALCTLLALMLAAATAYLLFSKMAAVDDSVAAQAAPAIPVTVTQPPAAADDNGVLPGNADAKDVTETAGVATQEEPRTVAIAKPPAEDSAAAVTGATQDTDAHTDTNAASRRIAPEEDGDATLIVRRHEPSDAERRTRAAHEGFAALKRGDWSAAARLLGELVAIEPANDDAREGLAVALVQQGRIAEVEGVLLDGLAVSAEPARFAKLRARVQASQNDITGALQSLSVTVPPIDRDPEFHALRGALAQQAGDFALAAQTYRQLVVLAPQNATWQAGFAMALDGTGDADGARDAYRRALALGGLDAALLEHVKQRLQTLGE